MEPVFDGDKLVTTTADRCSARGETAESQHVFDYVERDLPQYEPDRAYMRELTNNDYAALLQAEEWLLALSAPPTPQQIEYALDLIYKAFTPVLNMAGVSIAELKAFIDRLRAYPSFDVLFDKRVWAVAPDILSTVEGWVLARLEALGALSAARIATIRAISKILTYALDKIPAIIINPDFFETYVNAAYEPPAPPPHPILER